MWLKIPSMRYNYVKLEPKKWVYSFLEYEKLLPVGTFEPFFVDIYGLFQGEEIRHKL